MAAPARTSLVGMATRLVQVNMKARDDAALGAFWAQALGWTIASEEPGVTNLEPEGFDGGLDLGLDCAARSVRSRARAELIPAPVAARELEELAKETRTFRGGPTQVDLFGR